MSDNYECKAIENCGVTAVPGFKAAGIFSGIKKNGKDMALLYSQKDAVAAGVFTKNLVQAAPVRLCRKNIHNPIRAIITNSGNANACTGQQGVNDAEEMARVTAQNLNIGEGQVLVCSTGVIGEPMPMDRVRKGVGMVVGALSSERHACIDAAEAILTTDTKVKEGAYRCETGSGPFHLAGMSKGSGMICPNMATMLAYLVTDVVIERPLLQKLFQEAVDASFNMITVDGDTSTNDTALIMANGAAEKIKITEGSALCEQFKIALGLLCRDLARKVVEDGEGVTKVITLTIKGAPDLKGARSLAHTVLNSPLVKTAFYGEDANWGRILCALGYGGVKFDPDQVDIYIGPIQVAAKGGSVGFSEKEAKKILEKRDISVLVNLNSGSAETTAWGTDMSHDYISINSHYRS